MATFVVCFLDWCGHVWFEVNIKKKMFGLRLTLKKNNVWFEVSKEEKKASLAWKVVQGSELFLAYPFHTLLSFMFFM